MFCGSCGSALVKDDRFCRKCGKAAVDETAEANGYPPSANSPTLVMAPPSSAQTAVAPAMFVPAVTPVVVGEKTRPTWLIPTIVAATLLLLAGIAALILIASPAGAKTAPIADQSAPILAPVDADVSELSDALAQTRTKDDLGAVSAPAARLGRDSAQASSLIQTMKFRSADAKTKQLLTRALTAASDFAQKTEAAAKDPRAGTLGPARDAADAVRLAFAALSTASPTLIVPSASQFSIEAIADVSSSAQRQAQAKTQQALATKAKQRSYVNQIDRLLQNSADTRSNLGDLISGVGNGSISAFEAKSQIASIVNQRQDLQNAIAAIDAPAGFTNAAQLLRSSLTAAIDDDIAIQGWVDAWASDDQYTFDRFWQKHLDATAQATREKGAFVDTYNNARRSVLHLGPFGAGASY